MLDRDLDRILSSDMLLLYKPLREGQEETALSLLVCALFLLLEEVAIMFVFRRKFIFILSGYC